MSQADTDGGKVDVVDTSVLVSAPDALHTLTAGNTVVIPFPVLRELDRRRTDASGGDAGMAPANTVEDLLDRNVLEITPINCLRGRSIHDAVVIVDDGQNVTQEDMTLVLTRAGEGTRVIVTGDPDQIDRTEIDALSNGLVLVVERVKGESSFAHLTMTDVVRSRIAELAAKLL